jgi:hypothetical protein
MAAAPLLAGASQVDSPLQQAPGAAVEDPPH